MKHFVVGPTITLWCLAFIAGFTLGTQEAAPKLTVEQRAEIAQLQKQDLELLIQLQQVQKKYQDALNADATFKSLSTQKEEIDKKLQAIIEKTTKGTDLKKWRLNAETLEFEPVTPQEKEKK